MRKIFTIAAREYRAMVATKAFMISMAMMPLLMFGGILAMEMLENVGEISDQKIVIIDGSNQLMEHLQSMAEEQNRLVEEGTSPNDKSLVYPHDVGATNHTGSDELDNDDDFGSFSRGSRYKLIAWEEDAFTKQDRLELSERIRRQELYAFVEIPVYAFESSNSEPIKFYSEDSNFSDAKSWIARVINDFIHKRRLTALGVDLDQLGLATAPVPIKGLGLVEKTSTGQIQEGKEKDEMTAIFLPLGVMMLMFMVIFMASQPMLESVIEEKSHRIAEVLLGSANPFQLMTGKLLGTVGGSLTIFAIYLTGSYLFALYRGWMEYIPLNLIPWFILFQIGAVLFYASIFMAIGASVTQLKEAQTMLLPVWMLMMSPMFVWFMVIREPNGPLSKYLSFFPPTTPTMMMLRMSTGATIPIWQPILGMFLLMLATIACIYIAARIFRVGLLWQGKTPKFTEMMKWAFRG